MENLKHEEKPSEADEEAQPQQVVPVKAEANLAEEDSETIWKFKTTNSISL